MKPQIDFGGDWESNNTKSTLSKDAILCMEKCYKMLIIIIIKSIVGLWDGFCENPLWDFVVNIYNAKENCCPSLPKKSIHFPVTCHH
jgi:hypothetical protein